VIRPTPRLVATALALAAGLAIASPAAATTPTREADVLLRGGPLPGANGLAFTPGGKLAVTSAQAGRISLVDPATGRIERRFGPREGLQAPDDVAAGRDGALYWTGFLTGTIGRIGPDGRGRTVANVGPGANPIAFAPDGRLYTARCALGDALYEVDPAGVRAPRVVAEGIGAGCAANAFDFGPDGRLYAPQPFLGRVVAIDVDRGTVDVVATGFGPTLFAVEAARDGTLLAADGPVVTRIDPRTGARTPAAVLPFLIDNLELDARGRLFASSLSTAAVVEVRPDGSLREVVAGGPVVVPQGVASAPGGSGELLVATSSAVTRFALPAGAPLDVLAPDLPNTVSSLDARPERWVTVGPYDGSVTLFDPATRSTRVLARGLDFPTDARLDGDGVLVAEAGAGRVLRLAVENPGRRDVVAAHLGSPTGLAARDGDLWVTDVAGGRVLQLAQRGRALRRPRVVARGLDRPLAIAVEGHRLAVLESGAGRVVELRPGRARRVLTDDVTPLNPPLPGRPTDGTFAGLAFADGALLVADPIGNRVLRVAPRQR